jgi:hypothetical protein
MVTELRQRLRAEKMVDMMLNLVEPMVIVHKTLC